MKFIGTYCYFGAIYFFNFVTHFRQLFFLVSFFCKCFTDDRNAAEQKKVVYKSFLEQLLEKSEAGKHIYSMFSGLRKERKSSISLLSHLRCTYLNDRTSSKG